MRKTQEGSTPPEMILPVEPQVPSSSLDPPETNAHFPESSDYQTYRVSFNPVEFQAANELYEKMDFSGRGEKVRRLSMCSKIARFARNNETGRVKVFSSACHLRWCSICAKNKAVRVKNKIKDWMDTVKRPRFLTLTMRHSTAPLSSQIDAIHKHFKNFRRHPSMKNRIVSGVWALQIEHNDERMEWHPHIHCIIVGSWIPQREIADLWLQITKTSKIVHIESISDMDKAADYLARYVARPTQLTKVPEERRQELYLAVAGRRLYGQWGEVRRAKVFEKVRYDPNEWKDLGSWAYIINKRFWDPRANAIFLAWQHKHPIPDDIDCVGDAYVFDNTIVWKLEADP